MRNPGVPTIQWGLPPSRSTPILICIGPSPGYTEHLHNEPYTGKAGQLLRTIYLANLANLCTIYLTYMVRCGPEPDAKARDFKSCFSFHTQDLSTIVATSEQPIYVLLLGSPPVVQFHRLHLGLRLSAKEAFSINGRERTILNRTMSIFSTIHPAAVLRNNSLIYTIEDHIDLLTASILGAAPTPTEPDIRAARSPHN